MPHAVPVLFSILAAPAVVAFDAAWAVGLPGWAATAAFSAVATGEYLALARVLTPGPPNLPTPEAGHFTNRQSQPPRFYAWGRCRVSGPFACNEAVSNVLYRVIALPEGPIAEITRYWLHDDRVTLGGDDDNEVQDPGDQRYRLAIKDSSAFNPGVWIETRLGAETETPYAHLIAELTLWTNDHRGDGVPSLYMRCQNPALVQFSQAFPNGPPEPSVEALYAAYDWRDEAQDRDDPSTWTGSQNWVVNFVNVLWRRFGHDWDREIAPGLDLLTAEADICDEAVPLKAGGTQPRYRIGGFCPASAPESRIVNYFLECADGWIGKRRDGAIVIRAGHYYEPTVVFGDREIWAYDFDPGPTPDQVVNGLTVSFTDPSLDYTQTETDAWGDNTSDAQPFYPAGVQYNGQVRRLAKRQLARLNAARGSFTTPLSARRGLGERYIGLNITECDDLNGVTVEIVKVEIDLSSASITWTYLLADPEIDEWDPATEEGDGPIYDERLSHVGLPIPAINAATGVFDSGSARIEVTVDEVPLDALTWSIAWRVHPLIGDPAYVETTTDDRDPGGDVDLLTGLVPADADIDVKVRYRTGGGRTSSWSDVETVSTSTAALAPAAPTAVSAADGVGHSLVSWTNPPSANLSYLQVFRGTSTSFGSAVAVSGHLAPTGLAAPQSWDNTGLAAGTYRYWVVAYNAAGVASTPTGPDAAVVS